MSCIPCMHAELKLYTEIDIRTRRWLVWVQTLISGDCAHKHPFVRCLRVCLRSLARAPRLQHSVYFHILIYSPILIIARKREELTLRKYARNAYTLHQRCGSVTQNDARQTSRAVPRMMWFSAGKIRSGCRQKWPEASPKYSYVIHSAPPTPYFECKPVLKSKEPLKNRDTGNTKIKTQSCRRNQG